MSKVIISDTSCLIILSKVNRLEILRNLFEEITITPEVNEEFGEELPLWIGVKAVSDKSQIEELETKLDKGEASSIALALETATPLVIIDELKGRKLAQSLNLEIIGTIGVILMAHHRGLISDAKELVNQLIAKGFRVSPNLLDQFT